MWKVVAIGALLACLGVVDTRSYFDGAADYWYSNDDGIILESLSPFTLFRSRDIDNNSRVVRSGDNDTARRMKIRELEGSFNFDDDDQSQEYEKLYLRSFTPPPLVNHAVLVKVQKATTPTENWHCSVGPDITLDTCNHCICAGGQLYLCTARKCQTPDVTGLQVYSTYREKFRDSCIEGENIQSFDCNRCWCSGGEVLCTVQTCSQPRNTPNNRIRPIDLVMQKNARCTPGEPQPSLDGCNVCGCNRRGELFCTAKACGVETKVDKSVDAGCVPMTWYTLETSVDQQCRECYCVDGKIAMCFMKLCKGTLQPHEGYLPVRLFASIQHAKCEIGTKKHDPCTRCVCTPKQEWKCHTRLINKCSNYKVSLSFSRIDNPFAKYKKPQSLRGKLLSETEPSYVSEIEVDNSSEETTPIPKKNKRKRTTTTTTIQPDSEEYYSYEEEDVQTTPKPNGRQTSRNRPNQGEIAEGTQCVQGQAFTMGSKDNCQGCFCTSEGLWKCYSVKSSCRGWDSRPCDPVGGYNKNPNIGCSVCHCGKNALWMCFTDESCAQKIKKTMCDPIVCSDNCKDVNWSDGFCHRDKCTCL